MRKKNWYAPLYYAGLRWDKSTISYLAIWAINSPQLLEKAEEKEQAKHPQGQAESKARSANTMSDKNG